MANSQNFLDELGRERNNPEPAYPDFSESSGEDTMLNRMRSMVRHELSNHAQKHEMETFEEANDFDVEDDFEMDNQDTPYMKEEYVQFRQDSPHGEKGVSPPTQPMGEGENVRPMSIQEIRESVEVPKSSGDASPKGETGAERTN